MKLFFKEHRLLIVVQCIQYSVLLTLLILDGSVNMEIVYYSIFISFLLFLSYLIYRYFSHNAFYKRLSNPLIHLEHSLQREEHTPLSNALTTLLKEQYQHYHNDIFKAEKKQEEHLYFIDRWIHQMKTPLSVLELMAQDLDEPASSSFREELDQMKIGLQMVLNMARLRTIEQDFHSSKVELLPLIQDVNQEFKRFYIRHNVYPHVIEEQKGLTVETDEKWLFFILSQFVHNAVKYSTESANQFTIRLSQISDQVLIEIQDFGVGIPKEDLKRVFDAFYTGENGRRFRESTGVGLFLVREITNHLGHSLSVDSVVGEGSTFRIIFK